MTRGGWLSWPVTSAGSRQRSRCAALTLSWPTCTRPPRANPANRVAAAWRPSPARPTTCGPPQPVDQPGYILRQLWMQAAELAEDDLAADIRSRLQSRPSTGLVPRWTTRRASRALSGELGRHDGPVNAVAVLPDGRVVTGGDDGRVLVWDPAPPGAGPAELGRHDGLAVAWRWRCCRTGGWSPAGTTGGCWCGTRPSPAPARPSSAATTAG